jgi:hypothetical protein
MNDRIIDVIIKATFNSAIGEAAAVVRDIGSKVMQTPDVDQDKLKTLGDVIENIAKAIENRRVKL